MSGSSDCVEVCGNVCCVAAVVKSFAVLKYVSVCVRVLCMLCFLFVL